MQVESLITVREYLATSYHPDREFIDGVLLERNVGERDHSRIQTDLSTYLNVRADDWGIRVFVEQRVQVKATRFRVPDICIIAGPEPEEQILTSPPLACIEILSREDRWSEVLERVEDYLSFGVRYVWVIDPRTRKAYRCSPAGLQESQELRSESPDFAVPLNAFFK